MTNENDSNTPMSIIVRQGAGSFWDDAKLEDNPYAPYTKKWHAWREGWTAAKLELNLKAKSRNDE